MLKLHYLNLMKEMQETALMLNLFEQHQLMMQQRRQREKYGEDISSSRKRSSPSTDIAQLLGATKRQKV